MDFDNKDEEAVYKPEYRRFVDIKVLFPDSGFNVLAKTPETNPNPKLGCLLEPQSPLWPLVKKVELPELPWQSIGEGFGRLRIVNKKTHPNHVLQEGPKHTPFNKTRRNKPLRKFHYIF